MHCIHGSEGLTGPVGAPRRPPAAPGEPGMSRQISARAGAPRPLSEGRTMTEKQDRRRGEVLRLRNLAMIENIRRASDPAWREALERQQTLARLGRRFRDQELSLDALLDYAHDLKASIKG